MDAWLEISSCEGESSPITIELTAVRAIPALSQAISAAQKAGSSAHAGKWDYSLRISQDEVDDIKNRICFASKSEDDRSTIYSADVSYCDSCYALRLFIEKSQ